MEKMENEKQKEIYTKIEGKKETLMRQKGEKRRKESGQEGDENGRHKAENHVRNPLKNIRGKKKGTSQKEEKRIKRKMK